MAANSSLDLTSLDFDTLKSNFVTFLKSQNTFKDYNFEGSNMNVLLDVMSYNTFLNSFYLNMVASEMFLDSAQKYDSVVSHAKELNYVPESYRSSTANVDIVFETAGITNGKLTIPKGTIFSGINSNGTYSFVTSYNAVYTSGNSTFYANNVELYEGSYTSQSFVTDYSIENQRFILTNPNIDLNSLTINVIENNGHSNTLFSHVTTLYGLNANSTVYFIQASQNNNYEIVFGDNTFGRRPQNGSVISANYRICNGPVSDGISIFQLSQSLDTVNNGRVNVLNLTAQGNSTSGSFGEDIETIRFRAPRWYATQQRGVSNDDYKSLVLAEFGSYIEDINVFGGQQIEPKQYGSVVLSIKPFGGTTIPEYLKNQIINYLLDKSQMKILIRNPDYLYLTINSTIQYDSTKTSLFIDDIQNIVLNNIETFSATNLEHFNSDFRYSRFVNVIDNSEPSIISNQTHVYITKKLSPLLNYATSYVLNFNNSANIENFDPTIGYNAYVAFSDEPVISSTAFTYVDSSGNSYSNCRIRDDNVGNLVVFTDINGKFIVVNNKIGTIDYTTGTVIIDNLITSYYNEYISINMVPLNKDVIVDKNMIILIDPPDVSINIIEQLV